MKEKLTRAVEERLKERHEYLSLIEAIKALNFSLYEKMVAAEEKRAGALFSSSTSTKTHKRNQFPNEKQCNEPKPSSNSNTGQPVIVKELNIGSNTNSFRSKTKALSKKRSLKKPSANSNKSQCISSKEESNTLEVDEEEIALKWAQSILAKEFDRRI